MVKGFLGLSNHGGIELTMNDEQIRDEVATIKWYENESEVVNLYYELNEDNSYELGFYIGTDFYFLNEFTKIN